GPRAPGPGPTRAARPRGRRPRGPPGTCGRGRRGPSRKPESGPSARRARGPPARRTSAAPSGRRGDRHGAWLSWSPNEYVGNLTARQAHAWGRGADWADMSHQKPYTSSWTAGAAQARSEEHTS